MSTVAMLIDRRRDHVSRAMFEKIRIAQRLRMLGRMIPYANQSSRDALLAELESMSREIDRLAEQLKGIVCAS